jgi:hypothetical protein
MAKRGRKPKERKGYFYETEEQAVIDYISTTDKEKKNKIFNDYLYPAFVKMIESIIRRYNLYCSDEEFQQTFDDTLSYLMSKISHYKDTIYEYEEIDFIPQNETPVIVTEDRKKEFFKNVTETNPKFLVIDYFDDSFKYYELKERKYKAFSYCQTVVRNYLIYKRMQLVKDQQRNTSYDTISETFENDTRFSTENQDSYILAEKLINQTSKEIREMIESPEEYNLSDKEIKVGYALCDLLDNNNWENLIKGEDSNKLLKSSVLYFLREETLMSTKEIRDNMRSFKKLYYTLKQKEVE